MKRNIFTTLFFAGIITVFVTVCVNADDNTQPNKWKNAETEISEASESVTDATVDSSKKAWKGSKKTSGEAWNKTKDVSSDTWDKTKHATKEDWEKAKTKVHDASAPASD